MINTPEEALKYFDRIASALKKQPDMVNKPPHYNKPNQPETIDQMIHFFGADKICIYCRTNAFKYRMRAGDKVAQTQTLDEAILQDIKKAMWYEKKEDELNRRYENDLSKFKKLKP